MQIALSYSVLWVRPGGGDPWIECRGTSAQSIERKRSGDISGVRENLCLTQSERQKRQHSLRSIQQRDSFLGFQRKRSDACLAQRFSTVHALSIQRGFAFAGQNEREMGEWGKIAGSAHRTLRGN